MASGYISRLIVERGFGFIVEDGQSDEIEFHWTAIQEGTLEQMHEGQRIEFERRPDHRSAGRFRAVNVRVADSE